MNKKVHKPAAPPLRKWKPEGLNLVSCYVGNGVLLYTANATNSCYPLGSVWVRLASNDFGDALCDIVDIYVPHVYRRLGIATTLMQSLLNTYGMLRTGTFTEEGKPLAKKLGWKQNAETGDWYLRGNVRKVGA